jgi:hypothetical protein
MLQEFLQAIQKEWPADRLDPWMLFLLVKPNQRYHDSLIAIRNNSRYNDYHSKQNHNDGDAEVSEVVRSHSVRPRSEASHLLQAFWIPRALHLDL